MPHLAGIRTPRQVPKVTSERLQVRLAMRFRVCCHENEVCGKHTAPPDPRTGQSMGQRDASMGMTGTQNGTFPYVCRVARPLTALFSESGTAWELWRFPQTAFSWQIWEKPSQGSPGGLATTSVQPTNEDGPAKNRALSAPTNPTERPDATRPHSSPNGSHAASRPQRRRRASAGTASPS